MGFFGSECQDSLQNEMPDTFLGMQVSFSILYGILLVAAIILNIYLIRLGVRDYPRQITALAFVTWSILCRCVTFSVDPLHQNGYLPLAIYKIGYDGVIACIICVYYIIFWHWYALYQKMHQFDQGRFSLGKNGSGISFLSKGKVPIILGIVFLWIITFAIAGTMSLRLQISGLLSAIWGSLLILLVIAMCGGFITVGTLLLRKFRQYAATSIANAVTIQPAGAIQSTIKSDALPNSNSTFAGPSYTPTMALASKNFRKFTRMLILLSVFGLLVLCYVSVLVIFTVENLLTPISTIVLCCIGSIGDILLVSTFLFVLYQTAADQKSQIGFQTKKQQLQIIQLMMRQLQMDNINLMMLLLQKML